MEPAKDSTQGNTPVVPFAQSGTDVRAVTDTIVAKHKSYSTPRNPYGRKGKPKPLAADSQVAEAPPAAESAAVIDRELVEKSVAAIVKAVDGVVIRKAFNVAKRIGADDNLAKELATNAAITVDEVDCLGKLSAVLAEKYGLMSTYAPEAMFIGVLLGWSARIVTVFRRLTVLEEKFLKQKKQEKEGAPSAQAN
jgi:hypothetical protein